jgi:hypothetical protein
MQRLLTPAILILLMLLMAGAGPLQETPPPPDAASEAAIDYPAGNDTLSGVVTITGTVIDPNLRSYELEYAPDPTLSSVPWTPVQGAVTQQVRGGILGAWDTTTVPDGRYVLRLRMNRVGGVSIDYTVHVEVINATPTPTFEPVTRTPTAVPNTPTPGSSPTPLIEQPPTRTPRPAAALPPTATPALPVAGSSPLQPDRLAGAARTGALMAAAVFGLLGLYALLRATARGELGDRFWRLRREVINPLFDAPRRRKK